MHYNIGTNYITLYHTIPHYTITTIFQVKTLTAKLKQAEARAEFAERSVQKLQKEVSIECSGGGKCC